MKSKKYAQADKAECVSCGACIKECPRNAIEIWEGCYATINADQHQNR
ncbi:MAG: 4Fe-4S binding protein [Agathobacter sp.]|nr:4Fe-4S binding protein [Agathobacter sp.]